MNMEIVVDILMYGIVGLFLLGGVWRGIELLIEKLREDFWPTFSIVLFVVGFIGFLLVVPPIDGDLEIYLDHNAYAEYDDETYTRIYATKYTWWGLGPDKYYEIKAIKGKWHIREHSKTKWTLMDFDGLGMVDAYIPEQSYPR